MCFNLCILTFSDPNGRHQRKSFVFESYDLNVRHLVFSTSGCLDRHYIVITNRRLITDRSLWQLRSSFTKAFSRNAKISKTAKHSSLGQLSSQDSSSGSHHYDDPHTIREGSNENSLEHSHEALAEKVQVGFRDLVGRLFFARTIFLTKKVNTRNYVFKH